MKSNNKKIFIATGGTGGHIFPAISLADDLKEKYNIEIITDNRGLKYLSNYNYNLLAQHFKHLSKRILIY